jgi:hypothetical protein
MREYMSKKKKEEVLGFELIEDFTLNGIQDSIMEEIRKRYERFERQYPLIRLMEDNKEDMKYAKFLFNHGFIEGMDLVMMMSKGQPEQK